MIDRKWIGYELPVSRLLIDRTRLQFFAKATGETRPIYIDAAAALAAGYDDVLAPPTFLFAVELDSGATERLLVDLQIPLTKLLHGEQSYVYHRAICAGDVVTLKSIISDIYAKKNGALEFVVRESRAFNQDDALVAELRSVFVCRQSPP